MSELESLVKEFFQLVDSTEVSDNGKMFFPLELKIASCRAIQGHRVGEIIQRMKTIVNAPPRTSDKEIYLYNNPEGCGECLGKGRVGPNSCKVCKGSGSSDPNVCTRCKGTGDPYNHEREWVECTECNGKGYYKDE
jgi:hypothetical protein